MAKSKSDMISKGKSKYEDGINAIGGARAYRDCGSKGGMDTAVCLAGLKEALDEGDWATKWANAMA